MPTITGYESADGSAWTMVGSDTFTMGQSVLVGLAVSSHVAGVNATAAFDNVTVTNGTATAPARVWSSGDIGATPFPGETTGADGSYRVTGSGTDIWGAADAFHFSHTPLNGDGVIVARVTAIPHDVSPWVKAGVMVRESLTPGSPHAFMLVSAAKGAAFQRRQAQGGLSVGTSGGLIAAPRWVKLQRSGNVFSAFESADGLSWTLVGTDTIAMGANVDAGLAVTSHATGAAATCTFDRVSVQ